MKLKIEYYPVLTNESLNEYNSQIIKNASNWDKPFFTDTNSYLDFNLIQEKIEKFNLDKVENIIVLGTGGSIQTLLALKHLSKKSIYPITSSRTNELNECLNQTKSSNSIVIPISRGGETLDVNSTIGTFVRRGYQMLGLSSKGTMHKILKNIDVPILDVPDLSGRFAASISNVAIVPALLAGIDVNSFLEGLEEGYKSFITDEISIAKEFASFLYSLYHRGYGLIFSMPYSKVLEGSVGLFVQEISESTGKEKRGMMGAYQSAPLCQHSVLEFLLGGRENIVSPLIWITENEDQSLILNSSIDYIDGKDTNTIIKYQAVATFQALIEEGIPSTMISIHSPNEKNIGNLVAFIQSAIYYLCVLLDVNWANNPKVLIGKQICNEALINRRQFDSLKQQRVQIAKNKFRGFFT